jgi:hypothetical protein
MEGNLTLRHSRYTCFLKLTVTFHSSLYVLRKFIKISNHTRKYRKDCIFTLWRIILLQPFFSSLRNKHKLLLMFSLWVGLIDWINATVYPVSRLFFVKFLKFKCNRKTEMLTVCTEWQQNENKVAMNIVSVQINNVQK